METDGACDTRLTLAIGGARHITLNDDLHQRKRKPSAKFDILFGLPLKDEGIDEDLSMKENTVPSRSRSLEDVEGFCESDMGDGDDNKVGGPRKKLKLSKDQVTLLEQRFREHNTLNQAQKQKLADKLNIQPRQVEVWFQNRRARSKLKQTEVDCEFLRGCCESLSAENQRLKKELQQLRSKNFRSLPYDVQLVKAAPAGMVMCPSCERGAVASAGGGKGTNSTAFNAIQGQLACN